LGKVYLVGAGPGAVDLLTVRAARLLSTADVVFHDALVHADVLALAVRANFVSVGKRCGMHSNAQRFINKRIVDAARQHEIVIRLKGGDPMLFGRAQEEISALKAAGVEFEVVPGVTAALAASASLGVSLSKRGVSRSVVFATPRVGAGERASAWMDSVLAADTAVLYMAYHESAQIAQALIGRGAPKSLPIALVRGASLSDEDVIYAHLGELAEGLQPWPIGGAQPILLCIGEVYREALDYALKGPRAQSDASRDSDSGLSCVNSRCWGAAS
jgi:uroporphyrin-III C-methyltransferase